MFATRQQALAMKTKTLGVLIGVGLTALLGGCGGDEPFFLNAKGDQPYFCEAFNSSDCQLPTESKIEGDTLTFHVIFAAGSTIDATLVYHTTTLVGQLVSSKQAAPIPITFYSGSEPRPDRRQRRRWRCKQRAQPNAGVAASTLGAGSRKGARSARPVGRQRGRAAGTGDEATSGGDTGGESRRCTQGERA